MATITGVHHLVLTVSDLERSVAWYSDLLGMNEVFAASDDTVSFKVLLHPESGWLMGLRENSNHPGDRFDEFRTGLDHVAFQVADSGELKAWEGELRSRGIEFTPAAETPLGSVVVFRDPDNIQLEFWLPG